MPKLSDRVESFTDSVIRRMTRISDEYGAINLSQGFPDFDPPKELLDALAKSGISGALVERAMSHAITEYNLPHRFLPNDSPDTRKQIILFCVTGLMSMVLTWHHFGYPKSAEEMASIAVRILSQPLFPDVEQLL